MPTVDPALVGERGRSHAVRDPLFDNVRFVAAVLIVLGHVLQLVTSGTVGDILWSGTWAFRIPVYVFVAGWFTASSGRAARVAVDVLGVYLVFDLLASVQRWAHEGVWAVDPWLPASGLWFLLSLCCWRLALPAVMRLRQPLAWATAASVLAGFVPVLGLPWSASRTVALFPLFLLGVLARRGDLQRALQALVPSRTRAVVGVVLLVSVVGVAGTQLDGKTFRMYAAYPGGVGDQLAGASLRLMLLCIAWVGVLHLLALVPRREVRVMTYVGSGSMYVYLLHMVLLTELMEAGFFAAVDTAGERVAVLLGAVAVALLLGSPPVRAVARPLVQPRRAVEAWRRRSSGTPPTTVSAASPGRRPPAPDAPPTPQRVGSRADG